MVTVIVAVGVVSIGLGGAAGAKQASGAPLKFGYVDPLPGALSQTVIVDALQLYVDDWNDRGGQNGQPIDIVYEIPSSFDPGAYIAAVNKLVDEDHVVAILNPGSCLYTLPVLRVARIPTFGARPWCGAEDPFFFMAGTVAPSIAPLKFAIQRGSKGFALMYPSGIVGVRESFLNPLDSFFENNPDVETKLVEVPMPIVATGADIDRAIAEMKRKGVDTIYAATQPSGTPLILEEAQLQGFGPDDGITWIFGPNLYNPDLAVSIPELEGTYVSIGQYPWQDRTNPEVKKMIKVLLTKGKLDKRDGFAEMGYQTGALVEKALKGIKGEVTSLSLLDHLGTLHRFTVPLTPLKGDLTDPTKFPSGGVILQVRGGKFVATNDFIAVPAKEFNN